MHAIGLPGRQVLRAGNLLAGRLIGEFKCDIGTVYSAPGEVAPLMLTLRMIVALAYVNGSCE